MNQEKPTMRKRITILTAALALALLLLGALPLSAGAAPSPWWKVLTGSRPTNLWEPKPTELEIETSFPEGFPSAAINLEVGGEVVGCLGGGSEGGFLCEIITGFPATEEASQLETLLASKLGVPVEVTGGPVGGAPFHIAAAGAVPPVELTPVIGTADLNVISLGGSGRLVVTLTNLGDAPVNATETPVVIEDHLPEGVTASLVEATSGRDDSMGTTDCEIEGKDVTCSFHGVLPPYEAIEIEIFANLVGKPPVAGSPGMVTVSGANAPKAATLQPIKVSPDPVEFGIERFSVEAEEEGGALSTQAGGHPFQLTTTIQLNSGAFELRGNRSVVAQPALPRNLRFALPAGLVGNARNVPRCTMTAFFAVHREGCADETAIGVASAAATGLTQDSKGVDRFPAPIFNLQPAQGEPARFGFEVLGAFVVIDTAVDPDDDSRIIAEVRNTTQLAGFLSSTVALWGTPGDSRHDGSRGWGCVFPSDAEELCEASSNQDESAFLRMPVSCQGPLTFDAEIEPWNVPLGITIASDQFASAPLSSCNKLPFSPVVEASPTSEEASGSAGFDFRLEMPNFGLSASEAVAEGQPKKVDVTLPEGVTINPSQADGLGACAPAEYARERFDSAPGAGCPESSKIGSVDIVTPLLEEEAHGSVYVAKPYDNPFGSLLALYMVAKIPERGILVKQAGKVELDPKTGQIVTTFDDLPQIPFSTFDLHFKEGERAPLVMPGSCGTYDVVAKFTPWHAADPNNPLPSEIVTRTSSFSVDRGTGGGPCPSGTPPFKPGFVAGTENNAAGEYSPFIARLTRNDGEQEFTRFSMKLPKGVIGKLAGIPFCSDGAIAAARGRTGPNGAQEELDSPSCPAASQIGRTSVGVGVGPALTYAPGKIYLAGPYGGAKLSIVAITTAKVGPFDLGTVVIRQALKVDPETAEVTTDGSSDPIPHILQGIVTHARDIRIFVDRDNFVLNPTSCEKMTANASVVGSGADIGSSGDDQTVDVSSPFQAADCASLGFKPKLKLSLRGGTKRGDTPKLKAVLTARKGDANIGRAQVTLPHSAFLEQAHIRTVCTRVQFRAGGGNGEKCPKGAIYGRARAISPLLDEPLVGPVYLRSSNHPLPDLVAALSSPRVDINLVGRIDSINGRIRSTFDSVPDAPVTKFTLEMQGGRKGLIVNSTNICKGKHRALANVKGQNGRRHEFKPLVKTRCRGKSKPHKHKR